MAKVCLLGGIVSLFAGAVFAKGTLQLPPEQPITLDTETGAISGTLQLPANSARPRVALLIAGSGPTDRDGNSPGPKGKNNSLKQLSRALADAGYASVRYDKRGIGASATAGPTESDLRFGTYVSDAVAWLKKLKADPRFAAPFVIGHSEGALIGMQAAYSAEAAALVSIAGSADTASTLLRQQLQSNLPKDLLLENERILSALERGELVRNVPAALTPLYRPSVQPYLISWFKVSPRARITELTIPVLIVQGTTDIQVSLDQAKALKAAKPNAVLAVIPGMNHVLKEVTADLAEQAASYGDPSLPLHSKLAPTIISFLREYLDPAGRTLPPSAVSTEQLQK